MFDIKDIHLGSLVYKGVKESKMKRSRICNFFKCTDEEIDQMYQAKSLDTETLLRWSKLLEYDFFRIYTQHLILYAPQGNTEYKVPVKKRSFLPQFKKNVYTKELIDFILERIGNGEMTKLQVITEYKIPKTTLYKWINKYGTPNNK